MTPLETGLLTAIPNYCGVATADGVTRGGVPVTAFNDRPVVWRLNNASSSYTAPHHLPNVRPDQSRCAMCTAATALA